MDNSYFPFAQAVPPISDAFPISPAHLGSTHLLRTSATLVRPSWVLSVFPILSRPVVSNCLYHSSGDQLQSPVVLKF